MTAQEHNRLIGIFFLIYMSMQVLGIVIISIAGLMFGGLAIAEMNNGDATPLVIIVVAIIVSLIISAALLIPIAMGGWKMLKQKPGAKTWGIVASVIALLNFPFGMALGVYALWFLMGENGKALYDGYGNNNITGYNPPPPPNGAWQ